ncbi:hypothetical protein BNCALIDO_00184 [Aeromonas phage vB_AdhM_TS9]|nr:hypothetical protein BNCALIDO_00184 [Aeromonas phage vB_AdhM_TS9]
MAMKQSYNCSAFVQTKSNPDAFINREVIAENFEQAKQKFNGLLQNYSFVSIDFETISVILK